MNFTEILIQQPCHISFKKILTEIKQNLCGVILLLINFLPKPLEHGLDEFSRIEVFNIYGKSLKGLE
jgi:hypothetical protein